MRRLLTVVLLVTTTALAQTVPAGKGSGKGGPAPVSQAPFSPPRLADGHPDFGGIWMAATLSAAFNVEEHEAKYGTPAYLPGMRAIADDNDQHRERDPVGQCHMHGVPRVMFPPFPLEILQDGEYVVILTETEHGVRIIPTDGRPFLKNYSSWNGDSRGRWDGDTLVVEVRGLNGKGWLDQAGNFVGEGATVLERFRLTGKDTLEYEATVTNPKVFSQPVTMRVPLRRRPADVELLEYGCIEGERDAQHLPSADGKSK
jgi:hypothetical protein